MGDNLLHRRRLIRAFAALPMGAALLASGTARATSHRIVVFGAVLPGFAPGIDVHVFGWAAQGPDGWIGQTVDAGVSEAVQDFPGFAAGVTATVPKGTAHTINGFTDKDGVRATGVCFEKVTDGSIEGAIVKLKGELTHAENPAIFKIGDPMSLEADAESGAFTYTLRGGGKDNVFHMKGQVLIS